jgi:hypothetical protein
LKTPPPQKCIPSPPADQPAVIDTKTFTGGSVTYKGISFSYDATLASAIVAETRSVSPLQCADDKPDGVHPQYIAFTFKGDYAAKHDGHLQKQDSLENEPSFFSPPEIAIYPVDGYKRAFAISREMVAWTDKQVRTLGRLSSPNTAPLSVEIPVLPWMDATPDFQIRIKRLAFGNGKGILFLTHYKVDAYDLIMNQGLSYLFQGLTSDSRYYVSGRFPIRAQFLPKDRSVREVEGFNPEKEDRPGNKTLQKKYAAYKASVTQKLRTLPADSYDPNPNLFENLIRSLKIENQN